MYLRVKKLCDTTLGSVLSLGVSSTAVFVVAFLKSELAPLLRGSRRTFVLPLRHGVIGLGFNDNSAPTQDEKESRRLFRLPSFGVIAAVSSLVVLDETAGVSHPDIGAVHGAALLALFT